MGVTLVTGGAGYVGAALVHKLLASGRRVRVIDNLRWSGETMLSVWGHPQFEFMRGDVTAPVDRQTALRDVTAVVHLAAVVGDPACKKEPELTRALNLEATCRIADEARAAGARDFIFVSTCSNYGISDPGQLATEESPLNPVSLYAETKVAAEQYLLGQTPAGWTPTVLRLATVYGVAPRMRFDLTVNEFARDAALGRKLVIFGELFWRPYVHVQDVAAAILLTLDSPVDARRGQVFNVGHTDENYQKLTLSRLLQERVPDLPVEFVSTGPDPRSYRVGFEKIARVLGFQPQYRVPQGLDEVISLVRGGVLGQLDDPRWRNS